MEKDRVERGRADELAGAMSEFFEGVGGGGDGVGGGEIGSADSITVTTVFGVVEESGNVTVISASGPSVAHLAFDVQEDGVEMTEDVDEEVLGLETLGLVGGVEVELMGDASGDEEDGDGDVGAEAHGFEADVE